MGRALTVDGIKEFLEKNKEAQYVASFRDIWIGAEKVDEDGGVVEPEGEVDDVVWLVLKRKQCQPELPCGDPPRVWQRRVCGNAETHIDDLFNLVDGPDDHVL